MIRTVIGIALLVLSIGAIGNAIVGLMHTGERLGTPDQGCRPDFEQSFLQFLAGLAFVSMVLMVTALLGVFSLGNTVAIAAAVAVGSWLWGDRRVRGSDAIRGFVRLFGIACVAMATYGLIPPYEAKLNASDASVYLGMAAHIARTGALEAEDPLVAEMTPQERQTLFKNRFPKDVTGPFARFPGGVRLPDPSRASVSFHFYHLWPVWLALGVTTIGSAGSIGLLSLFAAVSSISLFLLGRLLVGRGFALTLVVLLFSCFPQLYYSRFPLSEVPAQAFFLAGLLCFLRAINARGVWRQHLQLLAAALWGCLCLLRVDGVLFLLPALTCSFLFWIELRRSVSEWLPFGIALMLFLVLALIHQLAGGTYEIPPSSLPLIGDVLRVWRPRLAESERAIAATWVAAVLALAGLARVRPIQRFRKALAIVGAGLALSITAVWCAAFASQAHLNAILRHLNWLMLYLPGLMMPAIAVGIATLGISMARESTNRHVHGLLLCLLAVPLASLLVNPMVTATQPWGIRRFVPMVVPLLLTLALLGWHRGLSAAAPRLGLYLNHGYVLLAAAAVAYFIPQSAPLWHDALYAGVGAQVKGLADRIPADALVLLSDAEAGTQLQIPLQYSEGRPTLLVPLEAEPGSPQWVVLTRFLERQLGAGRRVFAVFQNPPVPPNVLAADFQLTHLFSTTISFLERPQVAQSRFPSETARAQIKYHAFDITRHRRLTSTREEMIRDLSKGIDFTQLMLPHYVVAASHVSHAERTGRWTDGSVARLTFAFPLPLRLVVLLEIIDVYGPNRGRPLAVCVGDDLQQVDLPQARETIRLDFEPSTPSNSIEIRIPNPTSPASRGESGDGRLLGIHLKSLRVLETYESRQFSPSLPMGGG